VNGIWYLIKAEQRGETKKAIGGATRAIYSAYLRSRWIRKRKSTEVSPQTGKEHLARPNVSTETRRLTNWGSWQKILATFTSQNAVPHRGSLSIHQLLSDGQKLQKLKYGRVRIAIGSSSSAIDKLIRELQLRNWPMIVDGLVRASSAWANFFQL
jgi:hypothetical protein